MGFLKSIPFILHPKGRAAPLPPGDHGGGADCPPPDPVQTITQPTIPQYQIPYDDLNVRPDYALGGLPLWSAASQQDVIVRRVAPFKKDQIDQSSEPGEQSLETWWFRSQSSFHGGTAQLFADSASVDDMRTIRYLRSVGINPWTPGKVSLLKDTTLSATASAPAGAFVASNAGEQVVVFADGTALKRYGEVSGLTTLTWGGTGTILSVCTDGVNYYAADATGIYKGPVAGGSGGAKIWNTGNASVVIRWVKQRLMAGIGASVYQLDAAGTGGPTLPTAQFVYPLSTWVWTDFAGGPASIFASGYVGPNSAVYKFTLDANGAVPTVTTGAVTIEMPTGELVMCMKEALASYLALGTTYGVRVGRVSGVDAELGPLSITTDNPVLSIGASRRYLYAGVHDVDSQSAGLWRIDLGWELAPAQMTAIGGHTNIFASATDLRANAFSAGADSFRKGSVVAVDSLNGRMVFAVTGHGIFLEHTSRLVSSGYLTTSRIRYHTTDDKLFKRLVMVADGHGSIVARLSTDSADDYQVGYLLPAQAKSLTSAISANCRGVTAVLSFTLIRDTDVTAGPEFHGYTLKALPAQPRQRLLTLPVRIRDVDADPTGQLKGSEGDGQRHLEFLEKLNATGDEVLFEQLAGPHEARRSWLVVVEDVEFHQIAPPTAVSSVSGVAYLSLRTLNDES